MDENALFRLDETAATQAVWRAAVDKALKGRPFDSLVRTTDDGIELAPLYPPAVGAVPMGRAGAGRWAAIARVVPRSRSSAPRPLGSGRPASR